MQHLTRITLLSLLCSLGACDASPDAAAALDRPVAEAALAAAEHAGIQVHDEADLEPFAVGSLVVEAPTLRDIVEGRVDAPMASAAYARDGEVCPQARAAAGEIAAPPPARPVVVAVADHLLDTPLAEACLRDQADGSLALVACEATDAAPLTISDRPDVSAGNCYWCADGFPCFGSKRRYEGNVVNGQCVSVGYAGCNCT